MSHADTLLELFRHNDWARDKLLGSAGPLSNEELAQQFSMGPGTLFATLCHLYGAERHWYEVWQQRDVNEFQHSRDLESLAELAEVWQRLSQARNVYLAEFGDSGLARELKFTTNAGINRKESIGTIALHVYNHGIHHRAQVLNMLRHLDAPTMGLDFLFFRAERPTVENDAVMREKLHAGGLMMREDLDPPAQLDIATLRTYFGHIDAARDRIHAVARELSDKQLDRELAIGLGTLRKTLLHIRDAEQWWLENWTAEPRPESDGLPPSTSLPQLIELFGETTARRNDFIAGLNDDDLRRPVEAYARTDLLLRFRLGESLIELCGHGTHHRAQALNMLRHLGVEVPHIDLI